MNPLNPLNPLRDASTQLRRQAMQLLEGGLLELIRRELGAAHIAGSVALDLMMVPDIDLYAPVESEEAHKMLALAPKIAAELERQGFDLAKIVVNNEHVMPDPRFPDAPGIYTGVEFVARDTARKWKLDLWGWDCAHFAAAQARHNQWSERLKNVTAADRDLILKLKQTPGYGKEYASVDVYEFALANPGASEDGFAAFRRL
jgi:hypothetical protein